MPDRPFRGRRVHSPAHTLRRRSRRLRSAKRVLLKCLPWAMIAAGICIVIFALSSRLSVSSEQQRLVEEYRSAEQSAAVSMEETPEATALAELPDPDATPDTQTDDAGEADTATLAVLTIPSIDLEVAVREGIGSYSLKYSVGHYPLSAMPGEADNCVILGHRNYTYGEFFNRLDELNAGDTIIIERSGVVYTYVVTEKFIVEPSDTYVLNPAGEATLTLITCTPIRVATHRLIVRCTLQSVQVG